MKTNLDTISKMIEEHQDWLRGKRGAKRFIAINTDLSGVDLSWANLSGADLSGANLSWANLSWANLSDTNLSGANLSWANLSWANLSWANLPWANLSGANLSGADLSWANLYKANLSGADLYKANLSRANLSRANLSGANLGYVQIVPEEGSFIGWKKLKGGLLAKLLIPEDAKRSSSTGRKCRASKAKVIMIFHGDKECTEGNSQYEKSFVYKVGETVVPREPFDENWWEECSSGIHFFLSKGEASEY